MLDRPTYRQVRRIARNMRELDRREASILVSPDPDEVAFRLCGLGSPYWAAMIGSTPIYAFGVYKRRPETWSVWGFGTDRFPEIAYEVSKFIKRVVLPAMRNVGVTRCECMSLAEKTDAHRWLRWLGAVETLQLFDYRGSGADFKLFAWR